ncbi:DUF6340 family protein [Parabacteroides sp. PF5-9]|uniref:DUF6340 family protein n=1 Tax=Parabacteroides sp. PF5-9 TaxID=1742404 RepID=UPI00247578CE|nr:DUF6340 family protein [Parabacteroides sp. PF5-9]MDH6357319.1 tetratricopeptide (TPR) repeat protein [Parabacteroides sp. PF5-9]
MRSTFLVLFVCLLVSCNSIRYVGIETYNPAVITFPTEVEELLVVNNAVPQHPESGYVYKLLGAVQDSAQASADSALFDACRALGKAIVDANYFKDVLLYHYPTRIDNSFYSDVKLTPERVQVLCDENATDAIISFDRLLFDTQKEIIDLAAEGVVGKIRVEIKGVVRAYLPGRQSPMVTVMVSDSLFWEEYASRPDVLNLFLPQPDDALRIAGDYIGEQLYRHFVPHWRNETRFYFTHSNSRWKEALAYTTKQKWEEAGERWKMIHEVSSGWKGQAQSASNVALCLEMQNQFKEAYEWVEKAKALYRQYVPEENRQRQLVEAYAVVLLERQRDDKKLDLQFGEE